MHFLNLYSVSSVPAYILFMNTRDIISMNHQINIRGKKMCVFRLYLKLFVFIIYFKAPDPPPLSPFSQNEIYTVSA